MWQDDVTTPLLCIARQCSNFLHTAQLPQESTRHKYKAVPLMVSPYLTVSPSDVTEVVKLEVQGADLGQNAVRPRPVVLPARLKLTMVNQ